MQKFTIRDIENLSGIKAHTLRIWEQRYNFFTAQRKASQHRIYSNEDLKKLLRIAYLYHSGWKVSKIALLNEQSILETVRSIEHAGNRQLSVLTLLEAAADFDENRFRQVLDELIKESGLQKTMLNVCYPFLQKVGLLWMTNNVIPAQEHFSSYIIQHRIIAETDSLPPALEEKKVVLFSPDGEHHELPLLFINYSLRKRNWRTVFLGCNVGWKNIKPLIDRPDVTAIYVHIITFLSRFEIDEYLEGLCKAFPDKKVVASGAAVQSAQRSFVNLQVLKSDEAIDKFMSAAIT